MEIVSLIIRLLIAVMFVVAGVNKFADLQATRQSIRGFGLPDWTAPSFAILLPFSELSVALLLVPASTVLWGAIGAIALLLIFIVAIGINLILGRRPDCNCFGQLHSKPIGWPMIVRNGILASAAGLVFWEGRKTPSQSVMGWVASLSNGQRFEALFGTAAFVVIALEGWLIFHLLRQNGRLLLRMDALEMKVGGVAALPALPPSGLAIGSPAPAFELPLLSGNSTVTLETLRAPGRPIALIFSDPDCGPCSALLPDIARWQQQHGAELTFALISRGSQKANRAKIGDHQLKYVLLQKDREVAESYKANGTPAAVLIGIDGKIASAVSMGSMAIAGLVATGVGTLAAAARPANGKFGKNAGPSNTPIELKVGDAAPPFKLPDLSGKLLDLSALKGQETLVLFWNPSCGFCSRMLPDLKRWEEHRPADGAPHLLVVSTGTVEANIAMGLRAPVVLDQSFATGTAFHVRGTPAAVLVDAGGRIASGVAVGAQAVLSAANHFKESSLTAAS